MGFSFGKRLKELREVKKISQEKIAELCEVSPSSVSRWETGSLSPNRKHITQLASALGVDVSDFYTVPDVAVPENVLLAEILQAAQELSDEEQRFLLKMAQDLKKLRSIK